MNCWLCGEPLHESPGQIVYWHKECRQEGRRLLRKQIKKDRKQHEAI